MSSDDYRRLITAFKMRISMSRKSDCWDNAVTETLFGSLKIERLHGMRLDTGRPAKDEVMDWIASTTIDGFIRRCVIPARWSSNRNGLPDKLACRHSLHCQEDVRRGQSQAAGGTMSIDSDIIRLQVVSYHVGIPRYTSMVNLITIGVGSGVHEC